jgi:hypothetical protein
MIHTIALVLVLVVSVYPSASLAIPSHEVLPPEPILTPARTAQDWYDEGYNKAERYHRLHRSD